jgi:hypothetical protein
VEEESPAGYWHGVENDYVSDYDGLSGSDNEWEYNEDDDDDNNDEREKHDDNGDNNDSHNFAG